MSNRAQAYGMWFMTAVLIAALFLNIELRDSGQPFRPLHIILLGPLALWCAFRGWLKWVED